MDVKNKFNRSQTIAPPLESLVETNLMAVCREKSDHGSLGLAIGSDPRSVGGSPY